MASSLEPMAVLDFLHRVVANLTGKMSHRHGGCVGNRPEAFATVLTLTRGRILRSPCSCSTPPARPRTSRRGNKAHVGGSGRHRVAPCRSGDQAHLRQWQDPRSAVSSSWAHSTAHHHPCSSADRTGDSLFGALAHDIALKHVATRQYTSWPRSERIWLPPNTVCSRRQMRSSAAAAESCTLCV